MKRYSGINGINGIRTRTGWVRPMDSSGAGRSSTSPTSAIPSAACDLESGSWSDVISVILTVTTRHGSIPVGMRQEAGTHRQAQPERKSTAVTVQRSSFQEWSAYCVCERGGRQDMYCKYSRICKYVNKTERGNKDSEGDFDR